jgi:hypothetical protein
VTSDHDTPPWIGWLGGLRLARLACLGHRWPLWCAPWARPPSHSLTPFWYHNRLAHLCSNTLSSAASSGDASWTGGRDDGWSVSRSACVSWGQAR